MVLEKIQKENDIKKLTPEELELLKDEIRQFLIESISVTGGHLASNLGVVELTMALHLCFNPHKPCKGRGKCYLYDTLKQQRK